MLTKEQAALAQVIKDEITMARRISPHASVIGKAQADGILEACESIARRFALYAMLDRAEFLRACGIVE